MNLHLLFPNSDDQTYQNPVSVYIMCHRLAFRYVCILVQDALYVFKCWMFPRFFEDHAWLMSVILINTNLLKGAHPQDLL